MQSYQCRLWGCNAIHVEMSYEECFMSCDVLFTEVVNDAPVRFRHSKPLTVARTNVDVD